MESRVEEELDRIKVSLKDLGLTALLDSFALQDILHILGAPITHKEHPLARLLRVDRYRGDFALSVAKNTSDALQHLRSHTMGEWCAWFLKKKQYLTTVEDFAQASSAPGEIRAADIVQGVLPARPVPEAHAPNRKTPDFEATVAAKSIVIEVSTKHMHEHAAGELHNFYCGAHTGTNTYTTRNFEGEAIKIRKHIVSPFGSSGGDTMAETVASKIASVKRGAAQATQSRSGVLWLDFQDEDMWGLASKHCQPYGQAPTGEYWSSGIWHGLYGEVGFPMLEANGTWPFSFVTQRFPGLFLQSPNWSAAVLSFADGFVLCENPKPTFPLPPEVFEAFRAHSMFVPQYSWISELGGIVQDKIERAHVALNSLITEEQRRWRAASQKERS